MLEREAFLSPYSSYILKNQLLIKYMNIFQLCYSKKLES